MKKAFFNLPILLVALWSMGPRAQAQSNREAPQAAEITMTARQYQFEPRTITVEKDREVTLIITSTDVDHGFAIDEFNVEEKIKANQTKVIRFTPTRTGRFTFYCSVYCGSGHRKMTGELIVTEPQQGESSHMQVTFDQKEAGVIFVESGGERIRIDTSTKTVTRLDNPSPTTSPSGTTVASLQHGNSRESAKEEITTEPYDYRLVNVPTPKRVARHSLNLYFTHRFSEPVRPVHQTAKDLLGLDSFSISSFGLFYGITDRLYVSAYRSPVCQPGLCKTIEIGLGYHLLDEAGRSPLALSAYASVEGDDNFNDHYTYNIQARLARSVTRYVNLFFAPAAHLAANGQRRFNPKPEDFFPASPLASTFNLGRNTYSFGMGVNARIRPTVSLMFEYTPRAGFKLGRVIPIFNPSQTQIIGFKNESEPEVGFGIEKDIGRHTFSLTFSNTQTTTTSRYNSSNLVLPPGKFIVGFNLYRRLL